MKIKIQSIRDFFKSKEKKFKYAHGLSFVIYFVQMIGLVDLLI